LTKRRLAEDFQLTLISIVAVLAFIFILPFGILRIIEGEESVAAADFLMIIIAVVSAAWAWRTGETEKPGIIISAALTTGSWFVAISLGADGLFWFYPLIMFVFYLAPALMAFIMIFCSVTLLMGYEILLEGGIFISRIQMFSFLATVTTASIFSFAFSTRNKKHRAQLIDLATKDPLTGLENRRSMEIELPRALKAKDHLGFEYGLIIVDMDHLKEINDNYGHAEGDYILKSLGRFFTQSIRFNDHAFRYGGDEFVILLANTHARGLEAVCRNLVAGVPAQIDCQGKPVTISLGAALAGTDSAEEWFLRADRCLYRAKEEGRNRFILEES